MKLTETSIQRPVLATVFSLAIILLGVIGFSRLPVREYPDIDPPVVSVTTFYRGASPSVVETEITNILEEQLATLDGVKTLTSSSREQGSGITIEFELNQNVDEAANEVRDKVARVRGRLPREAEDPIVAKVDVNAQPIMWLALHGTQHSDLELSDVADRVLKERLQRLHGVGSVFIGGERRYAMRVWLDPLRMAAHGLTTRTSSARSAPRTWRSPGGRVEGTQREFAVRTRGDLSTAEEFAAIIVSRSADDIVHLGDVAEVAVGAEDYRSQGPLQRRAVGRPRRGQAVQGQHARRGRRGAQGAPRSARRRPPRHAARRRLRLLALHPGVDPRGRDHAPHRHGAGDAGRARLPQELPRHPHPGGGHPDLDRRHLRRLLLRRLHHQHPHPAGAGAGHRPRGGRRHRHAREHRPPHGDGQDALAGGHRRLPGDRLRGARDHDLAGGGVHSGGVPDRHRGPALQRVRHHAGGGGGHLRVRGADPDADALLQGSLPPPRHQRSLDDALLRRVLRVPRPHLRAQRSLRHPPSPAGDRRRVGAGGGVGGGLPHAPPRAGPHRGPRRGVRHRDRPRGLHPRLHRPVHA